MTPLQLGQRLTRSASETASLHWQKPLIMGVLNCTPDSFSDGGHYQSLDKALHRADEMLSQGADIIDVGGESTRPGAQPVSVDDELSRVIPLIEGLRQVSDVSISIDTSKPEVMRAAVEAGASMINDVYALRRDGAVEAAAALEVPVCIMHMRGSPATMQDKPDYPDGLWVEVNHFFEERISACLNAGIDKQRLILDPGFGFGKSVAHNLQLVEQLEKLQCHSLPILLGVSRKSTIGAVLSNPPEQRMTGGLAIAIYAALQGLSILRTHDVDETNQAFLMIEAIRNSVSRK